MMEVVLPKRLRARQTIVTPAKSLGYDPLTFAITRSKFLVHEIARAKFVRNIQNGLHATNRLQLTEMVFGRLDNQKNM